MAKRVRVEGGLTKTWISDLLKDQGVRNYVWNTTTFATNNLKRENPLGSTKIGTDYGNIRLDAGTWGTTGVIWGTNTKLPAEKIQKGLRVMDGSVGHIGGYSEGN